MAFVVAILARILTLPLKTYKAWRKRCAEREVACSLELLGVRLVDSAVKQRLVADYLADRPVTIHASQLVPQGCLGNAPRQGASSGGR